MRIGILLLHDHISGFILIYFIHLDVSSSFCKTKVYVSTDYKSSLVDMLSSPRHTSMQATKYSLLRRRFWWFLSKLHTGHSVKRGKNKRMDPALRYHNYRQTDVVELPRQREPAAPWASNSFRALLTGCEYTPDAGCDIWYWKISLRENFYAD